MKRLALALLAGAIIFGSTADARPTRTTTTTTTTVVAPVTPTLRLATLEEEGFCLAHLDILGPVTGDCLLVPVDDSSLTEDDPWGRWDCRTMGNRICGDGAGNLTIYFDFGGELYGFDVNAPDRPACFVEPSPTAAGYRITFYSQMSGRGAPEYLGDPFGFEANCGPMPAYYRPF